MPTMPLASVLGRLGALVFLFGCQSTTAGESALVTTFMEASFDAAPGAEFQILGELRSDRIWRWERPIALRLEGVRSAEQEQLTRGALGEFARLSGVAIGDAAGAEAPNFRVIFDPRESFLLPDGQLSTCYASFRGRRDGVATIDVTLSAARPEVAQRCIRHELMHAFGFLGHSHRIRSVLSYLHNESALTRWDKVLIASLYDPAIHAGMLRHEVTSLLQPIIAKNMARFPD
jgi:Protein of unknown function (DUF2927)